MVASQLPTGHPSVLLNPLLLKHLLFYSVQLGHIIPAQCHWSHVQCIIAFWTPRALCSHVRWECANPTHVLQTSQLLRISRIRCDLLLPQSSMVWRNGGREEVCDVSPLHFCALHAVHTYCIHERRIASPGLLLRSSTDRPGAPICACHTLQGTPRVLYASVLLAHLTWISPVMEVVCLLLMMYVR